MGLIICHLELKELNDLVDRLHRHHKPVQGHRFSIGCMDDKSGEVIGGASCGRPVARLGANPHETIEVTRLVTNGHKNACSFLYSACARASKELGYKKIQTYILQDESGISLTASGWVCEDNDCGGGSWAITRKNRRTDQPITKKQRWVKYL